MIFFSLSSWDSRRPLDLDIRILSALDSDSDLDIRDYRFGLLSPAVILDIAASNSGFFLEFDSSLSNNTTARYG